MASRRHSFRVRVLGPCVVEVEGKRLDVTRWPAKAGSLLRLLAVVEEHRMTRDEAVELLWPEIDPEAGESNLRSVVHRMRRALGDKLPSLIVQEHGWVMLNPDCNFAIDADRLVGVPLVGAPARQDTDDIALLEEAADLYRGEPLAEDRYEDWAIAAREHLQRRWRAVCLRLIGRLEEGGDRERALAWAQRLLEADSLDEEAMQQILRLTVALGRRSEARRIYGGFERRLRAELGVGPAAETSAIVAPPGNLPAPASTFVGRKADLAEVGELLGREELRLLTLTGPGGVGKTRLALEAARENLDGFGDGVYLVSLAALRDPALIPYAVARVLGVREDGTRSIQEVVVQAIGQKEMLLVLDNLEHLLAGAVAVAELLAACPRLTVLATSRVVLHLSGEHVYPVAPLALPDPELPAGHRDLAGIDSVALFLQRARAVRPDLSLNEETVWTAAEVCRRLDGLPLAIELAAARARGLSLGALLAQLSSRLAVLGEGPRDLPQRQRTLRDTIDWSYGLLDEPRQKLFARLAVFAGGCTLEAVEEVCRLEGDSVLNLREALQLLAEQNLLGLEEAGRDPDFTDGARYVMLETIREYATERLERSGEARRVRQQHAEYYLALAERTAPELVAARREVSVTRLEREHDNLRAALHWSLEVGDTETGLRLAGVLWRFWWMRGYWTEGRRWLEMLLARGDATPTLGRGRALMALGNLLWSQGAPAAARPLLGESLVLLRKFGDRQSVAGALNTLGVMEMDSLHHAQAQALLEESLAVRRELNDTWGVAAMLGNLGTLAVTQGHPEQARALLEESLTLRRELGDRGGTAVALDNLAAVAWMQGHLSEARALLEEANVLCRELKEPRGISETLATLGLIAADQGDHVRALENERESLSLATELGDTRVVARCFEQMGLSVAALRDTAQAARLWGAAEALRGAIGVPLPPIDAPRLEKAIAAARAQLEEPAFSVAWEEGHNLSVEEAVACAFQASSQDTETTMESVAARAGARSPS